MPADPRADCLARRNARAACNARARSGIAPRDLRVIAYRDPRLYSEYPLCISSMRSRARRRPATGRPRRSSDRADRPGPNRAAHRHRAARSQGSGAHRVRRALDEPEPATGVPARTRPRRGLRDRGHRRQPLPRLLGGHRGQLHRPCVTRRGRRRSRARRASSSTTAPRTSTCPSTPSCATELARIAPMSGPVRAYLGNSGAEVVEASIKLARYATHRPYLVSRSWAPSTVGPTARSA